MLTLAGLDLTDYFPMFVLSQLLSTGSDSNPPIRSPLTTACPTLVTDQTLLLQYMVSAPSLSTFFVAYHDWPSRISQLRFLVSNQSHGELPKLIINLVDDSRHPYLRITAGIFRICPLQRKLVL